MAHSENPIEAVLYCLLQYAISIGVARFLFDKIQEKSIVILLSPSSCFALISQLYFSSSAFKYFSDSEIARATLQVDIRDQFEGYILAQIVVLAIILTIKQPRQINIKKLQIQIAENSKTIMVLTAILMVANVGCKMMLISAGYGSTYTDSDYTKLRVRDQQDSIFLNTSEILDQGVWLVAYLGLFSKTKFPTRYKNTFYTIVLASTIGLTMYFSRSRLTGLLFALIGIVTYQISNIQGALKLLNKLTIATPILILILPMASQILGRENSNLPNYQNAIVENSYRADLTDFAYALTRKAGIITPNFLLIKNGFLNAAPSVLFPQKKEIVFDEYSLTLLEMGFVSRDNDSQEVVDYQDSYFSAGVLSFGIVGFFLLPFLTVKVLDSTIRFAATLKIFSLTQILLIPIALVCVRVEVEFSNLFIHTRNALQLILIIGLFIVVLRKLSNQLQNSAK